jgi:hypothetical protein
MAVGSSEPSIPSNSSYTLVERWNGKSWKVVPSPNPTEALLRNLRSVSCVSKAFCEAVGTAYQQPNGPLWTVAEHWSGAQWSLQNTPVPSSGTLYDQLNAISCVGPMMCVAVGEEGISSSRPLAMTFGGQGWSLLHPPDSCLGTTCIVGELLQGIDCLNATTCLAVGESDTVLSTSTVILSLLRGSWSRIPSYSTSASQLMAIACSKTAECLAVGDTSAGKTLAERNY